MFDLGWLELTVIAVTALIVVGPKDLPMMFKKVGYFVGKVRGMARDFQRTMENVADESGLKETTELMKNVQSVKNPRNVAETFVKENIDNKVDDTMNPTSNANINEKKVPASLSRKKVSNPKGKKKPDVYKGSEAENK